MPFHLYLDPYPVGLGIRIIKDYLVNILDPTQIIKGNCNEREIE